MKNPLSALASRESDTRRHAFVTYTIAVLLCLAILFIVLRLSRSDLRFPFAYGGDVAFYHIIIKGMIERGWFSLNDALGVPAQMNLNDIPTTDHNFYLLQLKLLSLFTSNYALIVNLFYLLSFPLTTLSALYVFRRFGVSSVPAVFGSLLFTFLPFHFARGQNHLFLSSYYLIPLMVMVILWCLSGALQLGGEGSKWRIPRLSRPMLIFSVIVCVLIASTGTYYAFFATFFLLTGGAIAALRGRSFRPLLVPAALVAVIAAVVAINLLPSILYLQRQGDTPIVRRNVADAEVYGLRIAQLLLPISHHRIYRISQFKGVFNQRPFINENDDSALGVIGGCGLLLLIGMVFYRRREENEEAELNSEEAQNTVEFARPQFEARRLPRIFDDLSLLTIAGLLFGTIGGFGALFAFIMSPKIRAYNRISIYLAFFAIFAVVLSLEYIHRRYLHSQKLIIVYYGLIACALVVGIFDQTTGSFIPEYQQIKSEFNNDAEFVGRIESSVAPNSAIFQLPIMSFPENPKIRQMKDYDLAKGYLHSSRLKWSYGVVKNREGDVWQKIVTARPVNEMVESLSIAGFSGIWIDRFGYSDDGANPERELASLLQSTPLVSGNGRLVFYNLTDYARKLREKFTDPDWQAKYDEVINPLLPLWQDGFSDEERGGENYWRWCADKGRMEIVNNSRRTKDVTLEMSFAAGRDANLSIESELFAEQLKINLAGVPFSRKVTLQPGRHIIRFSTDAPRILAPLDSRIINFRIFNFKIRDGQEAKTAQR